MGNLSNYTDWKLIKMGKSILLPPIGHGLNRGLWRATQPQTAARILYDRWSYVENQVCRAWSACNIGPYCEPCAIAYPCWTYGCGNSHMQSMSIKDLNNRTSKIDIYPNPATDILNIKFTDLSHYEIENRNFNIVILDMLGRTQLSKALTKDEIDNGLSISNLTTGLYSIFISNNNGFNQSLKFVKQ